MSESEFRALVVRMLSPIAAFPVENLVDDGTPDICTAVGWIETKLGRLPKREESRVVVKMRDSQKIWHRRWSRTGARSWTLTLIPGHSWTLHTGAWAVDWLGNCEYVKFHEESVHHWLGEPNSSMLLNAVIPGRKS